MFTLALAGNNKQNKCHFSYGRYFTEKAIIAKPFDFEFSNGVKQDVLS